MRIFFTFFFLNMFCHLCFNPHVLCHFFYFFFIMVHFYISLTLNRKTHYFVIMMTRILEMTLIIIFLQDTSITFYVQLYSVIKASTFMLLFLWITICLNYSDGYLIILLYTTCFLRLKLNYQTDATVNGL